MRRNLWKRTDLSTGPGNPIHLKVKVIPRADATRVRGRMADGTVKISLKAPPADGKANEELIRFLADEFRTRRSSIRIVAGGTSRRKLVSIDFYTSAPSWFTGG